MGEAYVELLRRPHAAAGADAGLRGLRRPRDPRGRPQRLRRPRRVRRAGLRACRRRTVTRFFAKGMLLNVIASMDLCGHRRAVGRSASLAGCKEDDVSRSFFREGVSDESQQRSTHVSGRSRSPRSALFMVTLDNLVVTTALPVIRTDLDASIESLEWTVNAYTLTFAVLLLTGAALGDRFGRRRMFAIGARHLHARLGRRRARADDRGARSPRARCRASAARSSCR